MRKLSLFFALAAAFAACASAQLVSVGALGGVRLTDGFNSGDESRFYVIGASVEVHLPARFAVEADALYQRIGNTYSNIDFGPSQFFVSRERGNSWQFPLYVKYYFRRNTAAWQPFIGTGYAFRTISMHVEGSEPGTDAVLQSFSQEFRAGISVGASIAGGLRFHYGRLAILPQVRYTRWGDSNDNINRNEATLLLGVAF
ncbi:MAG: outer membrane beta-barrel protein [Bryobacteraceae bacterium]